MNENIKKFLEKAEADQELQARFSKVRDPEEAYKLAASVQGGFTKEEFVTEMKKLYEELTKDLSEEDLARVAGGDATEVIVSTAVSTTMLGSVIVANAAAAT